MNGPNLWSKHYRNVWIERSVDPRLPAWLRCAALAYGLHAANGHAPLASGELAVVLGKPGVAMDRDNVKRTLRQAKELGFLSEQSFARCLVVPAHAISGPIGNAHAACLQNHPARGVRIRPPGGVKNRPPDNALTCENVDALLESLNPHPTEEHQ